MKHRNDPSYRLLKWTAIVCGVLWLGYEVYNHFSGMGPGDVAYVDGNSLFKDQQYERAAEHYQDALQKNPRHHAAMLSLANSYVQLKRYDDALGAVDRAIMMEPEFGGAFATRGIIHDHLGLYEKAMADYDRALKMDPDVAKGMHWLDRLLYNVQDTPSTVADRLAYLRGQMKLPEAERVLKKPEEDARQRPYER